VSEIYSLDACALSTFFDRDTGFEKVSALLERADAGEVTIYMSAINLTEVIYDQLDKKDESGMTQLWEDIYDLPITFIRNMSDSLVKEAARLKYTYHIALGDVFGLAAAKELKATFVTSDHNEMEQIEQHEPISFLWLPAKPKK
jgi:PIN domain nuclease of toxin-antitoxin system